MNIRIVSMIIAGAVILGAAGRVYAQKPAAAAPREEEAFFVAKKAFGDGFYDVGLGLFDRFLKTYPDSEKAPEVELLIGQCYFNQNRYLEALEKFEELLKNPKAKEIKDAVLYWTAEVHFKGNNYGKAREYYAAITAEHPGSPYAAAAYYSLGWCLFEEKKFAKALEYFKVVEEKYPCEKYVQDYAQKVLECFYNLKDYAGLKEHSQRYLKEYGKDSAHRPYFYFYLAEAYYYSGEYDAARDYYEKTAAASPDPKLQSLSRMGIGWSYLKLKKYKEAQESFALIKPADMDQSSRDVLSLGAALIFASTENPAGAQKKYDELIAVSGDPAVIVQAYLGKGDIAYNAGRYQEAIGLYTAALQKASSGVERELIDNAHYGIAWACLKTGEFKEAIKEFQQIVKESGDKIFKVSALVQIGDAYQDAGEYRKAQESYDAVLKDYPDSFYGDYVQYQLGLVALKMSQYDAAIMGFLSLQRNFPDSKLIDDASYALGLSYFQRQDYHASMDIFMKFRDGFKDSPLKQQALYLLGSSLYNLGKFTDAIEAFKDIIRFYGNDPDLALKAEYEIADCFYRMGNEQEALARFKALRSKYPDASLSAEIVWWLGEYYYRNNKPELARRYFSAMIQDFPESPLVSDAYYALGWSYEEESLHDEAVENFQKVLEKDSTDLAGQAAIAIADIYVKEKNFDAALGMYNNALEKYPNLSAVLFPKTGDLLVKMDKYGDALDFYRKSLQTVPVKEMAGIQFRIAEVLELQGKQEEAEQEYLKVSYLYSDQGALAVKALLRVAQMYEDRANLKEAAAIYAKVVDMGVEESAYARERIEKLAPRAVPRKKP